MYQLVSRTPSVVNETQLSTAQAIFCAHPWPDRYPPAPILRLDVEVLDTLSTVLSVISDERALETKMIESEALCHPSMEFNKACHVVECWLRGPYAVDLDADEIVTPPEGTIGR